MIAWRSATILSTMFDWTPMLRVALIALPTLTEAVISLMRSIWARTVARTVLRTFTTTVILISPVVGIPVARAAVSVQEVVGMVAVTMLVKVEVEVQAVVRVVAKLETDVE